MADTNNNYYNKSIEALEEYIGREKKTITEVEWNLSLIHI